MVFVVPLNSMLYKILYSIVFLKPIKHSLPKILFNLCIYSVLRIRCKNHHNQRSKFVSNVERLDKLTTIDK